MGPLRGVQRRVTLGNRQVFAAACRSLLPMILITGAAGKTGRAIIQALMKRSEPVRALVHRHEQMPPLHVLGLDDVIVGDLCDRSLMRRAAQGVRAMYHMAPNVNPNEVSIGQNAIAAAQSAGVEHFVFHSVLHPQVEAMPHHWLKSRVEELLFQSALSYTILQPAAYMQNILAYRDQIVHGRYALPYSPETRLSLVDLEDVAEAAAIVLTQPGHQDETIELVGTPAMSQMEIADNLSDHLGYPVVNDTLPLELWARAARTAGVGEYQISALTKMFSYYETYGFAGNPNGLKALLQRQPASFPDFVKRSMIG